MHCSWQSGSRHAGSHRQLLATTSLLRLVSGDLRLISTMSLLRIDIRSDVGDDYSLTSFGSIVPSELTITPDFERSESSQNDNNIGNPTIYQNRSSDPDVSKQFDYGFDKRIIPASGIASGECGPSPLSAGDIRALVEEAARRYGVDQSLAVAVAEVESDLDRNRNSSAGARGPMQLMPATAERFGVADPCEPLANIDAGVRYLGMLLKEFKNPILAVAAYNAGEDRICEYGGLPPFPETVSYVAKVINHQLGLSMPRRKSAKGLPGKGSAEALTRGVVVTDKHRQWVAGVMQF